MRAFIKNCIISGPAFGIIMGLVAGALFSLSHGLSAGVRFGAITGFGSGCAFGIAMGSFLFIQGYYFKRMRPELTGEEVLREGPANHFLSHKGVRGWLYLTKRRLLFRSHHVNNQPHEWSVALDDITEVRAVRTAKVFPKGLRIITRSGAQEQFVVGGHGRWCEEILQAQQK